MKRTRIWMILFGIGVVSCFGPADTREGGLFATRVVHAQEDWRKEFDDVCSKTQDAMVFTPDELRDLVARCDKLRPVVEKLEESQRKVYLKRLRLCRDLYLFVLESRDKKQ